MSETQAHPLRRWRRDHLLVGYGFLLPNIVGLMLFLALPALLAFGISFFDWNGLGEARFAGVDNYRKLAGDSYFWRSLVVTAKLTILFVVLNYVFSLGLALLVKDQFRGVSFYRTAFFVPVATSMVVMSVMWRYIFQPTNGLLNILLNAIGLDGQAWLGSERLALYCVLVVMLFMSVGYFMVIFIAGINEIPQQYYEAAQIDGAGAWHRFRHITLPLLKPTSFFVILITIISSFQVFDQIYVLTQGGPSYATTSIVFYIYQLAFRYLDFGYAFAMAFTLFVALFGASLVVMRIMRTGRIE